MSSHRSDQTKIRDSLYGLMPLSAEANAIIRLPSFLRLDGIQQLGFASRVWPGARHTRFEHSLGVMHLTELAVAHLRSLPEGAAITDTDARVVIAAALLHDIGHYPFSHAIEELGSPVRSHEEVGRDLIVRGEIAATLSDAWGVEPMRVAAMIHGDEACLTETDCVLRGLLSGTLDMDKLDYLPRDARACNVPYGGVDYERLIDALVIVNTPNGQPRIGIGSKGISALHSLINARQEMFDNVYWHHTNRACMVMLLRAVQEALTAGSLTPDSLTNHDDASLLAMLQSEAMPAQTRSLAKALAERRIHKRALEISARATALYDRLGQLWHAPAARQQVELGMIARLREIIGEDVSDSAILIDIPKPERWKTDVWVQFVRPPIGMQPIMHWQDVVGIEDADLKRYEEHRRLIRLVADQRIVTHVRDHWEDLLDSGFGGIDAT
ncbi:MAG: HD domain-containing protein [Thermomicrobiales bacterium]|nr:HD domain-containing protein [Thermomicrobiales bacterium]MCO5219496.1 HD domain-containing protein [Thermomicrobiales bacterium]MCO5228468.1 HD domain-containing protein [Thermomicrobiales bacterium]